MWIFRIAESTHVLYDKIISPKLYASCYTWKLTYFDQNTSKKRILYGGYTTLVALYRCPKYEPQTSELSMGSASFIGVPTHWSDSPVCQT